MYKKLLAIIAVLASVVFYQNCSPEWGTGFQLKGGTNTSSSEDGGTSPGPITKLKESLIESDGFVNPSLGVHIGEVVNNRPAVLPNGLPVPGFQKSHWFITQWKKQDHLLPQNLQVGGEIDPVLGQALYSMSSPSNESSFQLFNSPTGKGYAVEITSRQGWHNAYGGSNLFLSTYLKDAEQATFNRGLELLMKKKVKTMKMTPYTEEARSDHSVVGQFFSGFTLQYRNPDPKKRDINMFIQIQHGDTRGKTGEYRGCYPSRNYQEIVYSSALPQYKFWSQADAPSEPLRDVKYNINDFLCLALEKPFNCNDAKGVKYQESFEYAQEDLENWKITSFYIGLENFATRGGDEKKPDGALRGEVELSVQLSDLEINRSLKDIYKSCQGGMPVDRLIKPQCQTGIFTSAAGPEIRYQCNCTQLSKDGWVPQPDGCYHKVHGSNYICTASKTKTYTACKVSAAPSNAWTLQPDNCYHLVTQEKCDF